MKKVSEGVYNLRCPYCGDSRKSLKKARGYIYFKKGNWHYYCHNCGIYKPYEIFSIENSNLRIDKNIKIENQEIKNNVKSFLKSVLKLDKEHPAIKYLEKRKIPIERWDEIYYCANPLYPKNKFIYSPSIAFVNEENGLPSSIIFRAIDDNSNLKHFCFNIIEETKPYNFYKVNKNKKIYIVEGIIDSLFFDNSVSILGINKINMATELINYDHVIIFDNEPHKKETIKAYQKAVNMGFNVFIWPSEISLEIKDINDFILAGYSKEELIKMVYENTYSGLSAKLRLTKFKV